MPNMPKRSRRSLPKGTRNKRVYSTAHYHKLDWRYYSQDYRVKHPSCNLCNKRKSQAVDHVIPLSIGGSFWDMRNHQAICNMCHARKTQDERKEIYLLSRVNHEGERIPVRGVP